MLKREFEIKNTLGIHLRPANMFANEAKKYKSKVLVIKDGVKADGKSIIELLLLEAYKGSKIELIIDGDDELLAMKKLSKIIERKFNEK